MSRKTPRQRAAPTAASSSHFDHTALFEFSKVINSSLEPSFIYNHILLTIMGKTLTSKGMVLTGEKDGTFKIAKVKGFAADLVGQQVTIEQIPKTLFDLSVVNARSHPWVRLFADQGVKFLLPMYIADQPIGFLGFGPRAVRRKFSEKETTYLSSLANISATAIEKSRTIEELQVVNRRLDGKIQELNTLFELGKEFGALLDPERIIKLFLFSLMGQIGVLRYVVCTRAGSDLRVVASRVDGSMPQNDLLKSLLTVRSATRVSDLVARPVQDVREVLKTSGMAVVVPMMVQGESNGVVVLGEKMSREAYSSGDLEFMTSLANLAMIALENARLFSEAIEKQKLEDELLIAREIQKGLLPGALPELPGITIAAENISSKKVGGDYYDVIPLDDSRYVIAIGDVSGKGTPAALLMANIQATIRALVPLKLSVSELTGRVNDLMCENTGGDKFVTFFWGVLDVESRTLTYVNAGHNYPYLRHKNGTIDRLDKGGMILGIIKTAIPYEQGMAHLVSGDLLVLFTDGVSEAMNEKSEEYGEHRLEEVIHRCKDCPAREISTAIQEDIARFTRGTPQSDDITMMIVKVA